MNLRPLPHSVRALILATLAIALLLALAMRRPRAGADTEVTLGVSALRISLPVFLAAEQRIFARHGLRVTLRSYPTAQPMVDDVALGRIDAGGFAAWPIVLLASARAPEAIRVSHAVLEDREHRLSYVLARRGSGLRFPRDLADRRVGVLPTVAYRRWLPAIARAAGVDPARVTVVPVEPSMQAQALQGGAVDLLFTNDPMATAMIQRGVADLVDDGPPCAARIASPFSFGAVALSGAFVRRAPDVARRLSDALDEAIARAQRDPAAARAAMRGYLRPDERPYVDRYPDTRYAPAREARGMLPDEISRARALGILDRAPNVVPL